VAPDRVRAVAIRQLSPTEQVLAHGIFPDTADEGEGTSGIPWVHAPDGRGLLTAVDGLPQID
jgi:hypothetical protein